MTPFGDPIVQLDCPKCGKRVADVAYLGMDLALVDRAELRRGRTRKGTRPQQVYTEAGLSPAAREIDVGTVKASELWRFECRCDARPVAHPDRLLAKVRDAVKRGEHHVRLD